MQSPHRSRNYHTAYRQSETPAFSSHDDERSEELCKTCKRIDFCRYTTHPMEELVPLGDWRSIQRRARHCSFCYLADQAIYKWQTPPKDDDVIFLKNKESWKLCIVYAPHDGKKLERYSTSRE